jgi:hypothetical protein
MMRLCGFAVFVVILFIDATIASAQLAITQDQAVASAKRQVIDSLDFDALSTSGPSSENARDFVTSATAVRGWAFSFTSTSSPSSFTFPLKLKVNPAQLIGSAGPIGRFFRTSEFEVTHSPFTVKEEKRTLTVGSDTVLTTTPSKTVSATFKKELVSPNIDAFDREFSDLFAEADRSVPKTGNVATPDELARLKTAVDAKLGPAVKAGQLRVKRALKVATVVGYTVKWDAGAKDEFNWKATAERGGLVSTTHPLGWNAEAAWTVIRGESGIANAYVERFAGAASVGIIDSINFKSEAGFLRYHGDGFAGIRDVLDPTKDQEWNLAQSVGLRLASGHYVTFAVRTQHIGTGDVDLAIGTEFGFKFFTESDKR